MAAVQLLELLPLALKVSGSNTVCERVRSRACVDLTLLRAGKLNLVRKRSGALPQLYRSQQVTKLRPFHGFFFSILAIDFNCDGAHL